MSATDRLSLLQKLMDEYQREWKKWRSGYWAEIERGMPLPDSQVERDALLVSCKEGFHQHFDVNFEERAKKILLDS